MVEKSESQTGWLFPQVEEAATYGYREEMRHFIESFAAARPPRETFQDGLVVNCVLDAAYRSIAEHNWVRVEYR